MADVPFISVRKYIKWGDETAGENTDTLVLTTHLKYFVDIRIYKPTSPLSPALPNDPSDCSLLSRLEWGFAGTAKSTSAANGKLAHTVWTHWIDSKTTEEVKDEGDMYPQDNEEVLEYGAMVNPEKGVVERYEECWIDLEPKAVGSEEGFKCWTLKMEGKGKDVEVVRGMLVRIGEYIQGVVRRGDEVAVGRWMWREGKGWERIVGIGKLEVPEEVLEVGYKVRQEEKFVSGDGLEWVCVETIAWS